MFKVDKRLWTHPPNGGTMHQCNAMTIWQVLHERMLHFRVSRLRRWSGWSFFLPSFIITPSWVRLVGGTWPFAPREIDRTRGKVIGFKIWFRNLSHKKIWGVVEAGGTPLSINFLTRLPLQPTLSIWFDYNIVMQLHCICSQLVFMPLPQDGNFGQNVAYFVFK